MCHNDLVPVFLLRKFRNVRDQGMGREETSEENAVESFDEVLDVCCDYGVALDCHGVCDVEHDGCET